MSGSITCSVTICNFVGTWFGQDFVQLPKKSQQAPHFKSGTKCMAQWYHGFAHLEVSVQKLAPNLSSCLGGIQIEALICDWAGHCIRHYTNPTRKWLIWIAASYLLWAEQEIHVIHSTLFDWQFPWWIHLLLVSSKLIVLRWEMYKYKAMCILLWLVLCQVFSGPSAAKYKIRPWWSWSPLCSFNRGPFWNDFVFPFGAINR